MNYQDFVDEAGRYFVASMPHLRYGQALMNYLWTYSPDVYNDVVSAKCDPFYDDAIVPEFLNFVYNRIYQINQASE